MRMRRVTTVVPGSSGQISQGAEGRLKDTWRDKCSSALCIAQKELETPLPGELLVAQIKHHPHLLPNSISLSLPGRIPF